MSDVVTLSVAGATVTISAKTLTEMWLERARAAALPPAATTSVPGAPAIGSPWRGGIYAGIVRGDVGESDYHLIASTTEGKGLSWENARSWASNLTPYAGRIWCLPSLRDQAVLKGNVPEIFGKVGFYWSGEKYMIADRYYAWAQSFSDGKQTGFYLDKKLPARAVLHIPVGEG